MRQASLLTWLWIVFVVLLLNSTYGAGCASPTILHVTNFLAHLGLGIVFCLTLLIVVLRNRSIRTEPSRATAFLGLAFVLGSYLVTTGNVARNSWTFWFRILASGLGTLALAAYVWKKSGGLAGRRLRHKGAFSL
jgi:hypothetical protein